MDKIAVGEVLRIIRIANDLMIKEVSKKIDVSSSYICEIEKGKKTISRNILEKILKLYDVKMDEFLEIVDYNAKVYNDNKLKKYQSTMIKVLKLFIV